MNNSKKIIFPGNRLQLGLIVVVRVSVEADVGSTVEEITDGKEMTLDV